MREAQKAYKEAVNIGSPQLQFKIGSGTKASTLKRRLTKMLEDESVHVTFFPDPILIHNQA